MTYKFTDSAERVIQYANDLCVKLGNCFVGTEHILYGLTREESGIANKVLTEQKIDSESVLNEIKKVMGEKNTKSKKILGFTPRSKKVLENASFEANKLKSEYIGTEHILIGIMKEGDSVAIRILLNLDVDLKRIYEDILKIISESVSEENKKEISKGNRNTSFYSTPTLNQFGTDLCENARKGFLDPIIGRKNEIDRVIQILTRRTKNNPCLIGEPGVRKNCNSRRTCI